MKWFIRLCLVATFLLMFAGAPFVAIAQANSNAVYRMDMSGDGTRFATSNGAGLTLYDAGFNQINFRAYASENDYLYINPVFSPDGTRILVLNEIWDSTTLETIAILPIDKGSEPRWSPDSQMILTLPRAAQIRSAQDGRLIRELPYWGYWWRTWGFDMTYFITGGADQIVFYDAANDTEIARYVFPGETVGGPVWNSDGTRFALFTSRMVEPGTLNSHPTGSGTQAILFSLYFVDRASGNKVHLEGLPAGIRYAAWSPDDQSLAGGSNAASLYVWDTVNGAIVESYALPPEKLISMLKYSPAGGRLLVGLTDSPVTSNLIDTDLSPTSTFSQTQLGGTFQTFAPLATLARFAEIAASCGAPNTLTDFDTTLTDPAAIVAQAQALLVALNALPEGTIPSGCAADLRAIAEAIIAEPPRERRE